MSTNKLLLEYIKEASIISEQSADFGMTTVQDVGDGPEGASGLKGMIMTKADEELADEVAYAWKGLVGAPGKIKFFLRKIPKKHMLQMMFPSQSRVQLDVEKGAYIEKNRSRPRGSDPILPSLDMWNAADKDLEGLYNFVTSFENKGSAESVLSSIAGKLRANWRPSFKNAIDYVKNIPEGKKRDLNRRLNKIYRLFFLNILKEASKKFTKQYPKDIYTYKGKKIGNMKEIYKGYVKLFG